MWCSPQEYAGEQQRGTVDANAQYEIDETHRGIADATAQQNFEEGLDSEFDPLVSNADGDDYAPYAAGDEGYFNGGGGGGGDGQFEDESAGMALWSNFADEEEHLGWLKDFENEAVPSPLKVIVIQQYSERTGIYHTN
jgi:hypothetical protein